MKKQNNFDLSVYVIIDPSVCGGRKVEDIAASAVKGGATMIQLRNKSEPLNIVRQQALAIQNILAGSSVPLIINDHVELVTEIDAHGVHIGQEDMSAREARNIIGKDKILGLTAFTRAHYDSVDPSVVDYVGTGPFYATLTKPDKPVLGAEGFADLVKHAPVPVVGIGGITPENAGDVIKAGAHGVAMMRGVTEADDPEQSTRHFVRALIIV